MMKKLSFLAMAVLLLGACNLEDSGTLESVQEERENQAEVPESAEEGAATEETKAEEEPAEEPAEAEFGKRSNPVPVGQPHDVTIMIHDNDFNSYEGTAELTIHSVQRGPEVLDIVLSTNQFNETPPEGYEYMMADVTASLKEAETEDYAWRVNYRDFSFIGSDGSPYEHVSTVVDSELSGEIYSGGSTRGYVVNMVKTDDPVLLVFEDGNWDNIFFATE